MITTNGSVDSLPFLSLSRAGQALALGRALAGAGAWLAPATTWRLTGLGALPDPGSSVVVSRLFGVRDLALAWGVAQPDRRLRQQALRVGVVLDCVDTVSGLLGQRGGAPRASLIGVSAGAAALVGLGLVALRHEQDTPL